MLELIVLTRKMEARHISLTSISRLYDFVALIVATA